MKRTFTNNHTSQVVQKNWRCIIQARMATQRKKNKDSLKKERQPFNAVNTEEAWVAKIKEMTNLAYCCATGVLGHYSLNSVCVQPLNMVV